MDDAADQMVGTDSSAVTIKTIARITMQPLPRYGEPRFITSQQQKDGATPER